MVSGRKPKPSHLKLVMGNPGKHPINANEPKPEISLPSPPSHLSDEAKAEWTRQAPQMYSLGLLSGVDRAAFAAYCQSYARWVIAEEALSAMAAADPTFRGLMIRTTNGNVVQNPLVGTANKAMSDMMRYAVEFGMTPSARSRIDAEAAGRAQIQDDPADKYFKA